MVIVLVEQQISKSGRGGKRPGAGRKKKDAAPPTAIAGLDLTSALASPPPDEIDSAAQRHLPRMIDEAVKLLIHGASEAAKITAAKEILDRGFGKPAVEIGGDAAMLPFMMAPPQAGTGYTEATRSEAKKYANLALAVLFKIATAGQSESARAAAIKAMFDRALGTVGKARMPDEFRERPLGKKEEASRSAETAATGRYATPAPPPRLSVQ